jgi:flagellar protein FliO/FliZ
MKSLTLTRGAALSGALALVHSNIALAASGQGENTPLNLGSAGAKAHASAAGGGSIVRTVVGLAIVIGVIYGISWIMRQSKAAKTRPSGQGLAQVATLPLGSGRSVALVRVGTELHLLGVAEQSVTPLRTFTEEEALDAGLGPAPDYENDAVVVETPIQRAIDVVRRMTVR